ncbi:2-hydroxyacid dehydrogenase [Pelagibacterium luteolum]|uniref:Lactate dehydrogenase n=1 Tax=Pelagibacterium luteolum TaxID=440168 RepID=A0A1G7RZX5_9HYPH|nr:2-hydroxyacid dehydrogenase [Pelagibacterium luteolum]SDG16307.1 Lactate dehydrogenase [Pelagibacterium luteolum]
MTDTPHILRSAKLFDKSNAELAERFTVDVVTEDRAETDRLLDRVGPFIRGFAVRKTIIDKAMIDRLPALEIISSYSAGTENIDTAYAREKGILVANTSHILAGEVANLALAQILSLTRNLVNADKFVRDGNWPTETFPLTRSLKGMKIGIVGFGHIGSEIAKRLDAMGARPAYTGPNRKPVDYPFYQNPLDLARATQMLVVTCPLTPETRGMIDAEVMAAIGSDGYLVNVARGPIVDERALIALLAQNGLAGAALDVFEDEPNVPAELIADRRVILTPHMASGTNETREFMGDAMVDALIEKLGAAPVPRSS